MKYDLIVVGGGPGGLMAAATAAKDGLKVILIERKKDIAEVNRLCGQLTNINMINVGGKVKYGYTEPLNLEIGTDKTRVHFPGPGFSIDYNGPLRPYYNYIHFSPSGEKVYREKDRFFAFFWEKESLLAGLLASAEKAGVEVLTETIGMGAENTSDGVKVSIRGKSGEKTLEARKAIAADGGGSKIVESLLLNKNRQLPDSQQGVGGVVGYVLEGVETEYRLDSWVCFTIPSLNPRMNLWMFLMADDRNILGTSAMGGAPSASEATERLMKLPFYERWFRHARVVKKLAAGGASGRRIQIKEPIVGNVLIVGNAVPGEATNPGAIAWGYQAAKATVKELNGEKAYPEYVDWWRRSFDYNHPTYLKGAGRFFSLNALCSDEEVDYLYHLVGDQVGVPGALVAKNLERIKGDRPQLYEKLEKTGMAQGLTGMKLDLPQILEKKEEA